MQATKIKNGISVEDRNEPIHKDVGGGAGAPVNSARVGSLDEGVPMYPILAPNRSGSFPQRI